MLCGTRCQCSRCSLVSLAALAYLRNIAGSLPRGGGLPLYDATRRSPLYTVNVGRAIYDTSVSQHLSTKLGAKLKSASKYLIPGTGHESRQNSILGSSDLHHRFQRPRPL